MPETRVLEHHTDAPPVGKIRLSPAGRSLLLLTTLVALVTLLGVGAAMVFGDGGADPRFGVETSVPSTPPAPTAPATTPPTTVALTEPSPQPEQGDQKANGKKPGKGQGRDKKDHSSGRGR